MPKTYYDTNIGMKVTEYELKRRGLDPEDGFLSENGIFPIEYNYPEYDKYTQTFEPDGEPHPKEEGSNVYVQDFTVVDLSEETKQTLLETLKIQSKGRVDQDTSEKIMGGFDYVMDIGQGEETLHFSYDKFDQGNFTDSATVILYMSHPVNDPQTLPTEVSWNAYRNYKPETGGELVVLKLNQQKFLPIYNAALNHKTKFLAEGGRKKAQIEAATTAKEVTDLMTGWGI